MKPEPGTQALPPEDTPPLTESDGAREAQRLIARAQVQGIPLRLLGGVAVQLRCAHAAHRALARSYADLDFASHKKQGRALSTLLVSTGYTADRRFNALHGERRLLFYDTARSRQIDIFLSTFEMCHKLQFEQRLMLHPVTLSPADLLLTKLQIVQLNTKDTQDILALLMDFPPVESPSDSGNELDMGLIARTCGQDWGWFTTVNDNLDRVAALAPELLDPGESTVTTQRIEAMKHILAETPKSAGWHVRAVAGRRVHWYELPDEVNR
jgi:hypothetical protein